jgi:hypothetical protein
MGVVQYRAGALIEHVRVEMIQAQQLGALLQLFALAANLGEIGFRLLDLVLEMGQRDEAALPLNRVISEIAKDSNAECRPDHLAKGTEKGEFNMVDSNHDGMES